MYAEGMGEVGSIVAKEKPHQQGFADSYICTFICWNGNVSLGEYTAQSRKNI